jgi:hypothetical protein
MTYTARRRFLDLFVAAISLLFLQHDVPWALPAHAVQS